MQRILHIRIIITSYLYEHVRLGGEGEVAGEGEHVAPGSRHRHRVPAPRLARVGLVTRCNTALVLSRLEQFPVPASASEGNPVAN